MKPYDLIDKLKGDKRFLGTCPECGQDFCLADAVLFLVDGEKPSEALAAIGCFKQLIKDRKQVLAEQRELMTNLAQNTSAAVTLGKIAEKIAPSFSSFCYAPADCRSLLEPIDYLVFPA